MPLSTSTSPKAYSLRRSLVSRGMCTFRSETKEHQGGRGRHRGSSHRAIWCSCMGSFGLWPGILLHEGAKSQRQKLAKQKVSVIIKPKDSEYWGKQSNWICVESQERDSETPAYVVDVLDKAGFSGLCFARFLLRLQTHAMWWSAKYADDVWSLCLSGCDCIGSDNARSWVPRPMQFACGLRFTLVGSCKCPIFFLFVFAFGSSLCKSICIYIYISYLKTSWHHMCVLIYIFKYSIYIYIYVPSFRG